MAHLWRKEQDLLIGIHMAPNKCFVFFSFREVRLLFCFVFCFFSFDSLSQRFLGAQNQRLHGMMGLD